MPSPKWGKIAMEQVPIEMERVRQEQIALEKRVQGKLAHGLFVGAATMLSCLVYLGLCKAFLWMWPDAIYTMSDWVAGPLLVLGFMSIIMLPIAGLYSLICMAGTVWLDWREAKRERQSGLTGEKRRGSDKVMNDVLYFGCYGEAGHYLYCSVDGKPRRNLDRGLEWTTMCDGTLLPQDQPQVEGEATLSFHHGYSIVSFWDRSGDHRGNSNSSFLVKGNYSFEEVLEMAREAFPTLFDRFDFEIKKAIS